MSSIKVTTDLSGLSKQYSSRDLPTHLKLKYREIGQGAPEEHKSKDKRDLKKELEEREKQNKESKRSLIDINNETSSISSKKQRIESSITNESEHVTAQLAIEHNLDADEPIINNDSENSDEDKDNDDDESYNDDDDEEDTAALLAELERIKKERAAEAAKEEADRLKREEKIRTENILKGNPLLNTNQKQSDFKVKRRWDDDVVFKNCAKLDSSSSALVKKTGHFINDTLRSEFHKKFMDRYIK